MTKDQLSRIMEALSHAGHIIQGEGYKKGFETQVAARCLELSKELQEILKENKPKVNHGFNCLCPASFCCGDD